MPVHPSVRRSQARPTGDSENDHDRNKANDNSDTWHLSADSVPAGVPSAFSLQKPLCEVGTVLVFI